MSVFRESRKGNEKIQNKNFNDSDLLKLPTSFYKSAKQYLTKQDIKKIQNAYDIIFCDDTFRKNIENLGHELKENKYVNNIVKFINSDKKRPISVPLNNK